MKEQVLFNLIKRNLIPDLESTDEYNPTDAFSKEKDLAIELKCRKTHYRFLLIEKDKYDKLLLYKNSRYINSIPNGDKTEIYSWNLKKLNNLQWYWKLLPETTEFNRTSWVKKQVALIDKNLAINITNILLNEKN